MLVNGSLKTPTNDLFTSYDLFTPLQLDRRYRSMRSDTNSLRDSFYLQAIRLLNRVAHFGEYSEVDIFCGN